jgi:hypothetical protein
MNRSNSGDFFGPASRFANDDNGFVRAIVVEEPETVRRMLEERESETCDRCREPRGRIEGIAFFRPMSPSLLKRMGRSDWALCSSCLNSLKKHGSPEFSYGGNQQN